jgi:hypothetical protein
VPGEATYWGDCSRAAAYLDGWDLTSVVAPTERDDLVRVHFVQVSDVDVPAEDGARNGSC